MRNVRTALLFAAVAMMFAVAISPVSGQGKGQGKGKGFQPGMGMGSPSGLRLLMNKGVQEELKITPEQITKIEKAQAEARTKSMEAFSGGGDRAEIMKQMTEESHKMAKEIVTPEQAKRLKQIELQVGGFTVLANEDVQKELKMTDAQKSSLKDLTAEMAKEASALFEGVDRTKMAEVMKQIESMNKKAMTQFSTSLTADQKKIWTEMTGPKFDYKPDAPRGPRRDL